MDSQKVKELKLYNSLARAGVIGTLLFILFGAQFGRKVQTSHPELVRYVSHAAVAGIFLLVFACCAYVFSRTQKERLQIKPKKIVTAAIYTVFYLVFAWFTSEHMIVAPIERIHFLKYGALSFFMFYSHIKGSTLRRIALAVFWSAYIGAGEESLQYWHPNRVYDLRDMLLNITGAFLGGFLVFVLEQWANSIRDRENTESTIATESKVS
jgi:VanZ family protein